MEELRRRQGEKVQGAMKEETLLVDLLLENEAELVEKEKKEDKDAARKGKSDIPAALEASGSTSKILSLEAGVPQGSNLTPSLFTLINCALPEVAAQENCPQNIENHTVTNKTMFAECGGLVCFVDDSAYIATSQSEQELSEMLSEKFQVRAEYLTKNVDTHLLKIY